MSSRIATVVVIIVILVTQSLCAKMQFAGVAYSDAIELIESRDKNDILRGIAVLMIVLKNNFHNSLGDFAMWSIIQGLDRLSLSENLQFRMQDDYVKAFQKIGSQLPSQYWLSDEEFQVIEIVMHFAQFDGGYKDSHVEYVLDMIAIAADGTSDRAVLEKLKYLKALALLYLEKDSEAHELLTVHIDNRTDSEMLCSFYDLLSQLSLGLRQYERAKEEYLMALKYDDFGLLDSDVDAVFAWIDGFRITTERRLAEIERNTPETVNVTLNGLQLENSAFIFPGNEYVVGSGRLFLELGMDSERMSNTMMKFVANEIALIVDTENCSMFQDGKPMPADICAFFDWRGIMRFPLFPILDVMGYEYKWDEEQMVVDITHEPQECIFK